MKTHSARVIADSISPHGIRLTTMELTYPRIIHAERLRHRVFSACVASSRAIPVQRFIDMVMENPYVPIHWSKNQKGMQADSELSEHVQQLVKEEWFTARRSSIAHASKLLGFGLHKQITNRLLEPWIWLTEIITGTEWSNFFHLRCHPDAHPEFQRIAGLAKEALEKSKPREVLCGQWHVPFVEHAVGAHQSADWLNEDESKRISVARCARLSYNNHEGKCNIQADLELHDKLLKAGHMSPFECVARPMTDEERRDFWRWTVLLENGQSTTTSYGDPISSPPIGLELRGSRITKILCGAAFCGNFNGWVQYRKTLPYESDILGPH